MIPPAWEDVWISVEPHAHIQAVGVDDAGRRQYLYHPQWRERRDRRKFARALALAEALPRARGRVTTALRRDDLDRERVLAASFRLLDEAAPRIGSARYLEQHGSRGLTTLQRRDAAVEASVVTLSFPGKSGKRALIEIDDDELAAVMAELTAGRPRSPLLSYQRGSRRVPLTPADVNAHVRSLTGGAFTAKDFRTLRGTILAAEALARIGTVDTAKDRKRAELLAVAGDRRGARQHARRRARQLHRPPGLRGLRARRAARPGRGARVRDPAPARRLTPRRCGTGSRRRGTAAHWA